LIRVVFEKKPAARRRVFLLPGIFAQLGLGFAAIKRIFA
jgi:hypothetical protein